MTVRYRSATLGEFIEHHSYDVSRGGMFIKTPSPFPAGTLLKFEVKIAEEQRLMQGVGRVVWKREGDQAGADAPAGMGIKFIKIDEASHAVIERLVENRGHGGPSAFDQSAPAGPSKSQRMFPEHTPSSPPTMTEGEAPPPPGVAPGDVAVSSSPSIEAQPSTEDVVGDSDAPAGEDQAAPKSGRKKTAASGKTSGKSAKQESGKAARAPDPAAAKDRPAGSAKSAGRRWFVLALVVLFVLGMLYVLTHKTEEPAVGMYPAGEVTPALAGAALGSTKDTSPAGHFGASFPLAGAALWPNIHAC